MILIGQYDSPFVRRVGIALTLYELPFEHRPWSTFGEAEKIRPYNPLTRVPTLVLDDGDALVESHCILDYLDSLVPAGRAMFPAKEPARHRAMKVAALAMGLGDMAVSLFYEKVMHRERSDLLLARRDGKLGAGLVRSEVDCDAWLVANLLWRMVDAFVEFAASPVRLELMERPVDQAFREGLNIILRGLRTR